MRSAEHAQVQQLPDGRIEVVGGYGPDSNSWDEAWRLTVKLEGDRIIGVELKSDTGLTPSDLTRFGWHRWLRVADAQARLSEHPRGPEPRGLDDMERIDHQMQPDPEGSARFTQAVADALAALPDRPGRIGRPSAFYETVADAYLSLVSNGQAAPTKTLSEDLGTSRETVSKWVHEARQRGLIPPARKGKAG